MMGVMASDRGSGLSMRAVRLFSILGLVCAAMVGTAYVLKSSTGPGFGGTSENLRLASNSVNMTPVYLDFTQPGWDEKLYLSDYSIPERHHYRTNFEHHAIKDHEQGMRIVIDEAHPDQHWKWDSGEVQTLNNTGYGRYEVIMKPAAGSGLVSSFFTFTGALKGEPHDEIDIEFMGKNLDEVEFVTFADGKKSEGLTYQLGFNASEEYHLYAFEWLPDTVRFYVDDALVHEVTEDDAELPRHAGRIMMNLWTGSMKDWHGHPEFQPGVAAVYKCISYRPLGNRRAQTCSDA